MAVSSVRHELTIQTPEGPRRMAWQQWQSGDHAEQPLILCVHGLTRNSHDFDTLARQLARHGRVICPDILGRGDSECLANAALYGYPMYISQMQQFLGHLYQHYHCSGCFWVGTSMGGLIGMMLAAMPGGYGIQRLVLNDVGPFIPYAALQRIADYVGRPPLFADLHEAEQYLRRIAASFGPLTDEQWRHLAVCGTEKSGDMLRLRYDPAISDGFALVTGDIDLSLTWQAVTCPVLVIRGAESDLLLPETARAMLQRADTQLVEFPGVGHAPMLMARDQIRAVEHFLYD